MIQRDDSTLETEVNAPNIITSKRKPRALFVAAHSTIEHLGLQYLGGVAIREGVEPRYLLIKDHDFEPMHEELRNSNYDFLFGSTYTGNHKSMFNALSRVEQDHPNIRRAVGGPHPSYFPEEMLDCAENVVMSEGFWALEKILRAEVGPGIIKYDESKKAIWPQPDRDGFYRDSPEHGKSRIKSVITMTGCPWRCTYCYNSTPSDAIKVSSENIAPELAISLPVFGQAFQKRQGTRLFPLHLRDPTEVAKELAYLVENYGADMVYIQDDVLGIDASPRGHLEKLVEASKELSVDRVPKHGQTRWEMEADKESDRRLDLFVELGVTGLTNAIESAYAPVRTEILDRKHDLEAIYEGARKIKARNMTLRTEQISALPLGTTSVETPINLEADLGLVKLNEEIYYATGLPTMAWFSIHAPYVRTRIVDETSVPHGFWSPEDTNVEDSFFNRAAQRYLKAWVGPEIGTLRNEITKLKKDKNLVPADLTIKYEEACARLRNDPNAWLQGDDLERYRDQNAEFRNHGTFFAKIPLGYELGERYLNSTEPFSYERLGRETEQHLLAIAGRDNPRARRAEEILAEIEGIRTLQAPRIERYLRSAGISVNGGLTPSLIEDIHRLAPFFAASPLPVVAAVRSAAYALKKSGKLETSTLSEANRHHNYEEDLYKVGSNFSRALSEERYPPKI
jgi:hypothetical protein